MQFETVSEQCGSFNMIPPCARDPPWEIVQTAREGVGDCWPLVANPSPPNTKLDGEQCQALDALLSSTNTVSLFRGGAGTGKSYVLRELVEQVRQAGQRVVVLAPQRQQVVEMEKAGFPSPSTVANFLLKRELAEHAVVVVDEAGQIGGRQMLEFLRLAHARNARVILSGDTRQHGAVEASDALLAIERHSGVRPVELHRIRRQDPALGRDDVERARIKQYRKAVESAAAGKLAESFARLDKMGAVVACGLGEQANKLADEYLRLAEQNASAVIVSQTWAEIHRVNSRVRDVLKAKGLLGANDATVQVLDRLDLTNAQKRDERFHPADSIIVFNQKVRDAEPGAKGKLAGILKTSILVEVGGKLVSVSNKLLDRISVCQSRELPIAAGDRLLLKANRRLASGHRVTNGELVTVKSVRDDGGVELTDERVLGKSFREFLPGYAVTSYGSQGKTVDYVLFSDSTVKAATNAQQWYVTISRGRRGIRIFTPDKEQLRENVTRSGHRPLALELAAGFVPRRNARLWDRLHGYLLRFGRRAADNIRRLKLARRHQHQPIQKHEHKITRMLGQRLASPRRSH
jgi:ATP-dependent exoDNAse (exonuclease V) alpha subunit